MQDFKKLDVWRRSHELTLMVYRVTTAFPKNERFRLTSQIRRCAVSIPANIAEGCGRGTSADMARFLQISMGSACELEYYAILAQDLEITARDDSDRLIEEVVAIKRMLSALIRRVRKPAVEKTTTVAL